MAIDFVKRFRHSLPAIFGLTASLLTAQVTPEQIRKAPAADWLTYAGDYTGQRHSTLTQINRKTVASLAPKWIYHVDGAKRLEASPLIYQGVMYVGNTNEVHALDARTGRLIWRYADNSATRKDANRGVAILGDRIFFVTSDAWLVALNRKTGAVLWQTQYGDTKKGQFATMAPLAVKDRLIVGISGGDGGVRGFVAALSAATGKELWRFWTIPAKGEPGSESWGGDFGLEWGGAATWMNGTYDPELNLVYWPTGNPWPTFYGGDRKGDNLYACSLLALDPDTGKLKWYFQFTPHDTHDWDAQSWPVLLDITFQGRPRKLLVHPNRNGFFYVLDRTNGEFLRATPFVDKLNWAKGVDAKGRPILVPDMDPTPDGRRVCPSLRGASNWMSPSFNPQTGLLYVSTLEQCGVFRSSSQRPVPMLNLGGTGEDPIKSDRGRFYLRAIDPKTGKRQWEYPMTGNAKNWPGTLSTAGGVIFFGDDTGQLVALDANTGRHLWHFGTGQMLTASPVAYMVDGKQYVTIAAGMDVFSFGLFEPAVSVPLIREKEEP